MTLEQCLTPHKCPMNDVRAQCILIVPKLDNTDQAKDVQGYGCHGNTASQERGFALETVEVLFIV